LDTRNACSIYKPAFRSSAHCIAWRSCQQVSIRQAIFDYEHVRSLHFKHFSGLQVQGL
jgi:hypothetical protein